MGASGSSRLLPFDSSKFPSEAELSEVATRLCSVRPEYKWSSGPDPEDHTICAVDLFGRVLISGERRKCHLSGATDYYGGILIHSVEVFPTWSDPFERAIEANVYLASVTGRVIMGIGNGGRPRESTWFRAKCRRGQLVSPLKSLTCSINLFLISFLDYQIFMPNVRSNEMEEMASWL